MREAFRVRLAAVTVVATILGASPLVAGQTPAQSAPEPEPFAGVASERLPAAFVGTWDYNALESINILTGRPEQAPRSATQGAGRGAQPPVAAGRTGGGGRGGGGGQGGGFGVSSGLGLGPTPQMMREQRDMSRDLLEVPEQYTISMADGHITFVDDIERERTYPVDGTRQKYRLGASEFNARVAWTGTQLRKEIEGTLGFRVTETYFLSPDGRRMFVIIRVGQQGRNRQQSGFNRVYDRVDPGSSVSAARTP